MGIGRFINSISTKFWINCCGVDVNNIESQFLHRAVHYQDKNLIDLLIKKGINLNLLNKKGNSALHDIVKSDDLDMADYLLLKNANPNVLDASDYTSLYYALKNNKGHMAEKLLSSGALLDQSFKGHSTLLHHSANHGHLTAIRILLNNKVDANFCDSAGNISAYYALANSNFEAFKLLAPHTNLNTANEITGRTLLHVASLYGLKDAAMMLINGNVNLGAVDHNGHSPIIEAIISGHIDIARAIINAGGEFDTINEGGALINQAAANGHTATIKFLLEFGISINACDANGNIPIHYAKTSSMIDFLCQNGAKVDFRDKLGYTSLHRVIRNGDLEKVYILLKHGANPDTTSYGKSSGLGFEGTSALYDALNIANNGKIASALVNSMDSSKARSELITGSGIMGSNLIAEAAKHNYISIIDFYIEIKSYGKPALTDTMYHALNNNNTIAASKLEHLGAEFDARVHKNQELLHKAVKNGWHDCVEKLLKLGVDPNSYDLGSKYSSCGHTPLYYAIESSDAKMVNTLLYYKADPNELDPGTNRHNVYHAVSYGKLEILKALINKDADTTKVDQATGQTPLMLAVKLAGSNLFYKSVFPSIIDLLLSSIEKSASMNLNIIDIATGKTCLQLAIDYAQVNVAKKLLENKFIRVDIKNDFQAILKLTNSEDKIVLAKAFIDSPALSNIDINNKYFDKGQTLLHKAAESGCDKIVEALKARGASLTIKDSDGYNASDIAIDKNCNDDFIAKLMPPETPQPGHIYPVYVYPDIPSAPPLEPEDMINDGAYTSHNPYLHASITPLT